MPINIDPEQLIGTKEAARMLQVSEREIRGKINRQKIPATMLGTQWVMQRKAIYIYMKMQELAKEYKLQKKQNMQKK